MPFADAVRTDVRVRAIHALPLEHRLEVPYGMARGLTSARQTTLVLLEASDGTLGLGEAWGPGRVTAALIEQFATAFVGESVYRTRPIARRLWAASYHMGAQGLQFGALGGIDTAAWDVIGQAAGRPVSDLIGGRARERVLAYASAGYITEQNRIDEFTAAIERAHSAGFRAVKIKIGLGPDSDAERVAIAREVMGDDAYVMVDVNGAYTVDTALRSIGALESFDVHWIEEPLSPEDVAGYARLRGLTSRPLAAGEAGYSRHALRPFVQDRLVDVIQPDVNKIGGVTEMVAVRDLAEANSVRYSPHCWSGAVSLASTLQVLATVTPYPAEKDREVPVLLEYDQGQNPLRDELVHGTPAVDAEGWVSIPDRPGLGIRLNREALTELVLPGTEIPEVIP